MEFIEDIFDIPTPTRITSRGDPPRSPKSLIGYRDPYGETPYENLSENDIKIVERLKRRTRAGYKKYGRRNKVIMVEYLDGTIRSHDTPDELSEFLGISKRKVVTLSKMKKPDLAGLKIKRLWSVG